MGYQVVLSPAGRLMLEETAEAAGLLAAFVPAFAASSGAGLLALAAERSPGFTWPAEAQFWREFAGTFLHGIARVPEGEADLASTEVLPPGGLFSELTLRIPAMRGAEYASPEVFAGLWREMEQAAVAGAKAAGGLKAWLRSVNPALHQLGRVTFHLAENKRTPDKPFAFMATFTHRLSAQDKAVHLPLARALEEYAGAGNQAALRGHREVCLIAGNKPRPRSDLSDASLPAHVRAAGDGLAREWWMPRRSARPIPSRLPQPSLIPG